MHKQLEARIQFLEAQLSEAKQKLEEEQKQSDQYRTELGHTKVELVQSQEVLGHTKVELVQSQEVLGRTRVELFQCQEVLGHTRVELVQRQEVLGHTKVELTECQEVLGHTKVELAECQEVLGHTRVELEELQKEHSTCKTFWIVPRHKITILNKQLGGGAWGRVDEGQFRGQRVAVKCVHESIMAEKTIKRVYREICTMAQVSHPNLVRFMAAVLDDQGGPMIITELLDTTLRKAYKDNLLTLRQCVDVFCDVASALCYLHELEEPIIHRDVSSANVLMKAGVGGGWIAKLSDFGSANWAKQASTMGEGAIVYLAPEAFPSHLSQHRKAPPQTTKIDVYSYGILLCEVTLREFPDPDHLHVTKEKMRTKHVLLHSLVVKCTQDLPDRRPTMAAVLKELQSTCIGQESAQQKSSTKEKSECNLS